MKNLMKIAAVGLVLCTTPAMAAPSGSDTAVGNSASAAAEPQSGNLRTKSATPKKYCADVVPDTGSRMAKRHCRTKAEWAEDGIDIEAGK
jgi:hypothetical protein